MRIRLPLPLKPVHLACAASLVLGSLWTTAPAYAQKYPVTPQQRTTATQTAQQGVPLSELAPGAPDEYTVRRGDTLWAISRMYLRSPWRWPELWGMNLSTITNPHLIYPGQVLYLDKSGGRARLSLRRPVGDGGTVKLSPRVRYEDGGGVALPTLNPSLIEPFLTEPEVLDDANALALAPRIVGSSDTRVLLARGDRAYARGAPGTPLVGPPGPSLQLRVFRNATPLKDPATAEILGYEAQYLGTVRLERDESTETSLQDGKSVVAIVPATVDVLLAREEIRAGDRLLAQAQPQLVSYVPRAPDQPVRDARIISVYGSGVRYASQNQIVSINKGRRDGIESGHVLAILKQGETIVDRTSGSAETLKLPNERAGLLMVFRTFSRVSYALVLEITDTPRAGDVLVNP